VIRNGQPWQVSTNFRVYGTQEEINADISQYQANGMVAGDNLGKNHWRYVTAWETLRKANGFLTPEQSLDLLSTISMDLNRNGTRILTHYSVVYDLITGDVQVVTDRNYGQPYRFKFPLK
jgi:hypothetical protein